ncbi:Glutamine synthetase [Hordeum vulgare]|nr:Glutamine synthetase [Hordeum vulgare]
MQPFVQAVDMLAVHLEHDIETQVGYFIGDHQLEDATAMFLYCAQVDTRAKEAVEPSDQRVGIERAAEKANKATHAKGACVRCKYNMADLWCKYVTNGLCPLLARNEGTDGTCTQL